MAGPALSRSDVVELIRAARLRKGLRWAEVAATIGQSKEWTTAACLGQMAMSEKEALTAVELFELPDEAAALLQTAPYRGSVPTTVPTDPLIYRFYELVSVYGTTLKELIDEEFGDGIMSAIDFSMDIEREPNPAGDRVRIVMSGKFLPYKRY
jgi:cyanate lyase